MLSWEGIVDSSNYPQRVWFTFDNHNQTWKPLRKCDCRALNDSPEGSKVLIESGRATADLTNNTIKYNFFDAPSRKLVRAIWFQKEGKGENKLQLRPIFSPTDELLIENLYQKSLKSLSSGNKSHMNSLLSQVVPLKDENTHNVYIAKMGKGIHMKKSRKMNLQSIISLEGSTELQRGYGDYVVDGELEEASLGPVKHLSFVIHGIGEAVWSREDLAIQDMVDGVDMLRTCMNKILFNEWKNECAKCSNSGKEPPSPPTRIEVAPVRWCDQIHSSSSELKNTLLSTTIQSIPQLRTIANDVVFDVLMYLTPVFCERVLTTVTQRVCDVFNHFQSVHSDFEDGGTCSLIGHSLGSVIVWDLLSILQDNSISKSAEENTSARDLSSFALPSFDSEYQAFADGTETDAVKTGTWGPALTRKMSKTIPFSPKFSWFLGSPLGMFLSLRGARPLFNDMIVEKPASKEDKETFGESLQHYPTSPFVLPSGSVYNIFHPSDPIAYRIEPLLLPLETSISDLPSPPFLVPDNSSMRLHVQAKQFSDNLVSGISNFLSKQTDKDKDRHSKKSIFKFALGGKSARVDYQLQPGIVENEYLSAISVHNSYWNNEDLHKFLIQCANMS